MRAAYVRLVDASICLLFVKGVLIAAVTIYTFARAYQARQATPAVGVAACAAGTFAFGMTSIAVWIRSRLEQPAEQVSWPSSAARVGRRGGQPGRAAS